MWSTTSFLCVDVGSVTAHVSEQTALFRAQWCSEAVHCRTTVARSSWPWQCLGGHAATNRMAPFIARGVRHARWNICRFAQDVSSHDWAVGQPGNCRQQEFLPCCPLRPFFEALVRFCRRRASHSSSALLCCWQRMAASRVLCNDEPGAPHSIVGAKRTARIVNNSFQNLLRQSRCEHSRQATCGGTDHSCLNLPSGSHSF